jgi:hypothetical protein
MTSRRGGKTGPRPSRPRRARAAAVIPALAAAALLATACGGSPSPAGSGAAATGTGAPTLASYAQCMRSHGVADFPGPDSSGQIPGGKTALIQLSRSNSHYHAAEQACQRLWPYQQPTQASLAQQLADDLKFAQCMRAHGLPNFPDPSNGPDGAVFVFSQSSGGVNPHSPQVLAKAHQCLHVLPAGSSLPHATEAP